MSEDRIRRPQSPKEIDVFNRHSNLNKLKIIAIGIIIAVVSITVLYFFTKSLLTYTVTYHTDGGTVYGEELEASQYRFLQKTKEPKNLKKEGYYIAGYYTDAKLTNEYKFGKSIWRSINIYVDWQPGYAVQLFFAEGEDDTERPEGQKTGINQARLKMYHEQYVKPGTEYSMPLVYNDVELKGGLHQGEQLLWYLDEDCSGDPFSEKTFNMDSNIQIYGKWFDTSADRFATDEEGTLLRYLGNCKNIILPSKVNKIKNVEPGEFVSGLFDDTRVADGSNYSAFDRVHRELEIVYINPECMELGSCAFKGCESLVKIKFLGNNVQKFGKNSFEGCSSLRSIDIPSSVKTIENRVFLDLNALKYITGGSGVETIGELAFAGVASNELRFDAVSYIGKEAFKSCYSLDSLILGGTNIVQTNVTVPSGAVNDNVLYTSTSAHIYVDNSLVDIYKTTTPWSAYAARIHSIDELTN